MLLNVWLPVQLALKNASAAAYVIEMLVLLINNQERMIILLITDLYLFPFQLSYVVYNLCLRVCSVFKYDFSTVFEVKYIMLALITLHWFQYEKFQFNFM